jgi:SAM-dependent methyltransferase
MPKTSGCSRLAGLAGRWIRNCCRHVAAWVWILILVAVATGICTGQYSLDRELNRRQPPDKVLTAAGVRPGMVVGEVGAGRGRYTVEIARRVGPAGKVYANDIDATALESLRNRCRTEKLANVETIVGEVRNPRFPPGALDLAFMINTFHHLDDPVALLHNLKPSLKPGATLVIVEKDPVKSPDRPSHSTPRETVERQGQEAGFELIRVETFLALDNIYIFRVKSGP